MTVTAFAPAPVETGQGVEQYVDIVDASNWRLFDGESPLVKAAPVPVLPIEDALDLDGVRAPQCPKARQSAAQHEQLSNRRADRRYRKEVRSGQTANVKFTPEPRHLTIREREQLVAGTLDIKSIHGCMLTRCERQLVRKLKKQQRRRAS